jgi:CubicO group peptidase (beta-lactamase class C family)
MRAAYQISDATVRPNPSSKTAVKAAIGALTAGLSVLVLHPGAAAPPPFPPLEEARRALESSAPQWMSAAHVPGLAIAIIDGGRTVWAKGFGVLSARADAPVTEHSRFQAASLTKPVTAYVALQLADAGRLGLDEPLTKYVKYADLPDDPRAASITARLVLSHRTGFANWRRNDRLALFFSPGERFSYSGEGYVYLQRAIEAITGETLDVTAATLVFRPLKMEHSSLLLSAEGPDVAMPHTDIGTSFRPRPLPPGANAAASLMTSVTDYATFVTAVTRGERLKPETAQLMFTPQVHLEGCTQCTDKPRADPSNDLAWGLGWGLEDSSAGRLAWHWGDNGGYKNYVLVAPDGARGFVFFTDGDNGLALRDRITAAVIGGTHPAARILSYKQLE